MIKLILQRKNNFRRGILQFRLITNIQTKNFTFLKNSSSLINNPPFYKRSLKYFVNNDKSEKNKVDENLNLSSKPNNTNTQKTKKEIELENDKKLSIYKRMRKTIKKYGLFGLYFYILCYVANLGLFYLLIKLKFLDSDKVFDKLESWGLSKYVDIRAWQTRIGPGYTDLVIAAVLNEIFDYVRLPFIIASLPWLFKKLKKK